MTATDVGKRFYDSQIALSNLEVTLARYQKILERAATVQEVLVIEEHLARVRGEIERVKGELRFLARSRGQGDDSRDAPEHHGRGTARFVLSGRARDLSLGLPWGGR